MRTIERAVAAARDGDHDALASLLSPSFFARLATGRIVPGELGFAEAVSFETTVAAPVADGFARLEKVGEGFVISAGDHPSADGRAGAWLFHVRDGRLTAVVHFGSAGEATRSLPAHLQDPGPTEVIERAIQASNRRDLVELVSLLAGDFEFVPAPGAPAQRGVPALLDLLEDLTRRYESYVLEPKGVEELADGFVVVEGSIHITANGRTESAPRAILARVENGLAAGWTLFEHVGAAREAAGATAHRTGDG